jgi:hypothetical protein
VNAGGSGGGSFALSLPHAAHGVASGISVAGPEPEMEIRDMLTSKSFRELHRL